MNQQNFHKLFTLYFIIFGIVISLCGSVINYYLQLNEMNKSLDKKASEIFKIKNEDILKSNIKNIDNTLKSLSSNQVFNDYIKSKKLAIISIPFFNSFLNASLIKKIIKNALEFDIEEINIITISNNEKISDPKIKIIATPFYEWALS